MAFDEILVSAGRRPLGILFTVSGITAAATILLQGLYDAAALWQVISWVYTVVLAVLLIWFFSRATDAGMQILSRRAERTGTRLDDQIVPLLRKAIKATVGIIVALWTCNALGIDVTAVIAGLGIGGLAVALGLQDTLANFFGSIFIMFDRPFRVGDRIIIENVDGVVEELGLRSTRIRTLDKTLVCIPNKTVANAIINNIARIQMRKVIQTVGVTYETTAEQMEQILEDIRGIVHAHEGIDQEFTVVRFDAFGDSSLNINIIYFTKTIDYCEFLKVKEEVNLAIMRAVAARGLSIAFPTRTLYFEGDIARDMARAGTNPLTGGGQTDAS